MIAALLLAGCAREKKRVVYEQIGAGTEPFVMRPARVSNLPPPDREPRPEETAVVSARSSVWTRSKSSGRLAQTQPEAREPRSAREGSESLRPEASTMASPGAAGPPPDEAHAQGSPEARHPDELTPLPAERLGRYKSPAPLKQILKTQKIEEQAMPDVAPATEEVAIDVSAAVASFKPQSTAALSDEVPMGVAIKPKRFLPHQLSSSSPSRRLLRQGLSVHGRYRCGGGSRIGKSGFYLRYARVGLLGFGTLSKQLRVAR